MQEQERGEIMNILVTADKNWAIGSQGQLLVSIPEDQRLLREETLGKVIVMGRKTFETLPGKQPLYGRLNVILTKDLSCRVKGAVVCHTIEEALSVLEDYDSSSIFVIGGKSIYDQFLPFCDTVHVTYIDYEYSADTYFPDLDKSSDWVMTAESDEQTYFDLCYYFRMYQRRA